MDRDGGCLCGATRYKVSGDPLRVLYCHCDDCRRAIGAPVLSSVAFNKADIDWDSVLQEPVLRVEWK